AIADCSTRRPLAAGSAALSLLVPVSTADFRANHPSSERTNGANRFLAPLGAVSRILAISPAGSRLNRRSARPQQRLQSARKRFSIGQARSWLQKTKRKR